MIQKKQNVSMLFMFFSILFCVCLILANLLETKQIAFGPISLTGGLIVFPISYIINDCVCEVWGFRKARLLIWGGFAMNFFFVAVYATGYQEHPIGTTKRVFMPYLVWLLVLQQRHLLLFLWGALLMLM